MPPFSQESHVGGLQLEHEEDQTISGYSRDDDTLPTATSAKEAHTLDESPDDFYIDAGAVFCTNVVGCLLGKTRISLHCRQRIMYSEERIKEMRGDKKIYFHAECKEERKNAENQKQELHNDLSSYIKRKNSFFRRSPMRKTSNRGAFARLFGACRGI